MGAMCDMMCRLLLASPSNYTYIMSSSESLLHKGSPGGSFSIGQRREMVHVHLDLCCSGQANPLHLGQTRPVQTWLQTGIWGWHFLPSLNVESDRRPAKRWRSVSSVCLQKEQELWTFTYLDIRVYCIDRIVLCVRGLSRFVTSQPDDKSRHHLTWILGSTLHISQRK